MKIYYLLQLTRDRQHNDQVKIEKKAPGTDNIPSELIKYGGSTLKQGLYNLILLIWTTEELPKDWTKGIICPIYKKGDRMECSNYWPITLLNIAYKIFAILLNNRLSEIVQGKLSDVQMGFRPDRSTVDNIFIIRQIFKNVTSTILIYIIYLLITHKPLTLLIEIKYWRA
jgi:hypothetical protein